VKEKSYVTLTSGVQIRERICNSAVFDCPGANLFSSLSMVWQNKLKCSGRILFFIVMLEFIQEEHLVVGTPSGEFPCKILV